MTLDEKIEAWRKRWLTKLTREDGPFDAEKCRGWDGEYSAGDICEAAKLGMRAESEVARLVGKIEAVENAERTLQEDGAWAAKINIQGWRNERENELEALLDPAAEAK